MATDLALFDCQELEPTVYDDKFVVNCKESYGKITKLYADARGWKKKIEARRKELIEPFRKKMSEINDRAKNLTDPLDKFIDVANVKSNGYLRMLEDIKRKEDELLREAAAMFDDAPIYIPPMEKNLRGDGATMIQKTEKKFRVLDVTKIPMKYLMVDEDAIKRDIKLGLSEIEGLEIYEETTTQLRMR